MKMIASAVFAAMVALSASAHAGVNWSAFVFEAKDAAGSPISDGTYRMLVDTTGDGIGTPSAGRWDWDSTDILLDAGQIGGSNFPGEAYPAANTLGLGWDAYPAGMDPTDDIYFLWFDAPYNPVSAMPGYDVAYGVELIGQVGADPGNYSFFPNAGISILVTPTVPEPSGLALLGLGVAALSGRRRWFGRRETRQ